MKVLLPQEKFYCKVLIFVPLCSLEQKRLEKQEQIQLYYFLEKFDEPPKRIEAVEDSITAIFDNADLSGWEDEIILKEYLLKIDVTLKTYKDFCNTGKIYTDWEHDAYFGKYFLAFLLSTEVTNKQKQKKF